MRFGVFTGSAPLTSTRVKSCGWHLLIFLGAFVIGCESVLGQTCTVDWTNVYQRIDGFGGGVVFLNGSPPDPVDPAFMDTLYGTNANQLSLSLLRVRIDPNRN